MDSIIVVEDEPAVLELYIDMLEMIGYKVRAFPRADQAWDYIEHCGHVPRMLITDLQMPGRMDGVRLVQKVRQSSPNVPIVVATGYHNEIDSLKHCEVYWLPKPFNVDQLISACTQLAPIT